MKKTIVALSTIFCTVLIAVSIYSLIPKKPEQPQQVRNAQTGYTIKDYGGKVALFSYGSDEPVEIYDIYTHLLPENDIELLRRGIYAQTFYEVQAYLEDFGL